MFLGKKNHQLEEKSLKKFNLPFNLNEKYGI